MKLFLAVGVAAVTGAGAVYVAFAIDNHDDNDEADD